MCVIFFFNSAVSVCEYAVLLILFKLFEEFVLFVRETLTCVEEEIDYGCVYSSAEVLSELSRRRGGWSTWMVFECC